MNARNEWIPGSQSSAAMLPAMGRNKLLHSDRLGEIAREINIEAFTDSEPVGNQLQWDDVEKTLETINSLGDLDLFCLGGGKLGVIVVADNDRTTTSGNDYWNKIRQGSVRAIYLGDTLLFDLPCW